jgi:hypothetical protein
VKSKHVNLQKIIRWLFFSSSLVQDQNNKTNIPNSNAHLGATTSYPPCTEEGTFETGPNQPEYMTCILERTIETCAQGSIFDATLGQCNPSKCETATDEQVDLCGSFDCSFEDSEFCFGTNKFESSTTDHFKRCRMATFNGMGSITVQVCEFQCDQYQVEDYQAKLTKVFSKTAGECVVPS